MAKQNNTIFWIIGGILVALLVGSQLELFVITGEETVKRSYTSIVDAGSIVNVMYKVEGASGQWGVSIIDSLSCPGHTGVSRKIVMISTEGTLKSVSYQIPNEEGLTCTFGGNYQFGDKMFKTFPSQTILTRIITPVCESNADSNNNGFVDRTELGVYIDKWISGTVTRIKLGKAIQEWVDGC